MVLGRVPHTSARKSSNGTHNMSCDMIYLDTFFDAISRDLVTSDDPRTRKRIQQPFNGRNSIVTMPKFHIYH
jgi:hypothetical protein